MWCVVAERFSSPNPSSGAVSSRVWVRIPVMTLVSLSKALYNHNCFVKTLEGSALCSANQAPSERYLAYILTDCEGGNPVSGPGVGGNVPLVTVDLGRQPKSVKCSPHLDVAIQPCEWGEISLKKRSFIRTCYYCEGSHSP